MSARVRFLIAACPYLFLILALSAGIFLAWAVPPFQNADELTHIHRADLLTMGEITAERVGPPQKPVAGGMVDVPFARLADTFARLQGHSEEKVRAADFIVARQTHFDGRIAQAGFPGSAPYPPVFYLPASAAFALGMALDWSLLDTLFAARVAMLLASAAIGFLALRLAGTARLPLYSLLLLPMSVSLASAITCDGPLLATTALAVALICRAISASRPMTAGEAMSAALCFAAVGATKPPYAVFGLLLLFAPGLSTRLRLAAGTVALGVPAMWSYWMTTTVRTSVSPPGTHIDPEAQLAGLIAHPEAIFGIAWNTVTGLWAFYIRSFVGALGWLDTYLPDRIYQAAVAVLVLAFALSASRAAWPAWRRIKVLTALLIMVAAGGVFLSMYLIWTDVGSLAVNGVQGRYLLPLAIMAALLVEGERRGTASASPVRDGVRTVLIAVVLAFPALSLAVTAHTVVKRYYVG